MRVIFMGTPDFAVPSLQALLTRHEVVAVVTQPDKPKGRGKKLQPTPVKAVALEQGIPVLQPVKVREPEVIEQLRGYGAGRFSFNVKGGRCEECRGAGVQTIEMNFLPDVYVRCKACGGHRYNRETLEVKYKGKNIDDVLNMTVNMAVEFFENIPAIHQKLRAIQEVGLGYLTLGQPCTTLSGGESQRIKLSSELSKRDTGRTLYILDEPTTGLHFEDIRLLLDVLNKLVDRGNTVIVIEHNLDVIKVADHIIDIGPEGGAAGGEIVAAGTPHEIACAPRSYTGEFLKKLGL